MTARPLIVIDANSGIPVFRQLVEQIRFHVASGLLSPGDELPSTRLLSQQLGVNPMTVSKAYALLEQDGVLERRPGLPSVVAEHPAETIDAARETHLRGALEAAVTAAGQLGITPTRAAGLFRAMLDESNSDERRRK